MHSGDRGLAGDVGHFDPASGIPGELQRGVDGHTLGGGVDISPIVEEPVEELSPEAQPQGAIVDL